MALFGKLFEKRNVPSAAARSGCWATGSWRMGTAVRTARQKLSPGSVTGGRAPWRRSKSSWLTGKPTRRKWRRSG